MSLDQWQLKVPPGIDGKVARALVQVINERWQQLPTQRVLVWHLASVVDSALRHLARALGVEGLTFAGYPPRELLVRGIDILRRRGTPAAMVEAIRALGYEDIEILEGGARQYDGSWQYDGTYRYGADAHWAIFFVFVRDPVLHPGDVLRRYDGSWRYDGAPAHTHGADVDRVRELHDVIDFMRPARCVLGAFVRTTAEGVRGIHHRRP